MIRKGRASSGNYGMVAEKRVDRALAELQNDGVIHFWFRAPKNIDAEGIDHIFGRSNSKFSVYIVQITSGKKKRRTYYRKFSAHELTGARKPYYRRRYYRYIPLIAVTPRVKDHRIKEKLKNISSAYKSAFENRRCPLRTKTLLAKFLAERGIAIPRHILAETP